MKIEQEKLEIPDLLDAVLEPGGSPLRRENRSTGQAFSPRSLSPSLRRDHPVHAEQLLRIGPDFFRREPRSLAQFLEFGDRVLAGNFGMDGFTRRKIEPP